MTDTPWYDEPGDTGHDDAHTHEPESAWEGEPTSHDEGNGDETDEVYVGELVPLGAQSGSDVSVPLTTDEARELTDQIRSTVDVLWVLVARAHAGRAWEALGYPSFAAYVQEEFNISRSRGYQLLNQARVVQAIEEATPEGTSLAISEAAARDLKSVLGDVTDEITERTANLPSDEAADVVQEIVEDYRDRVREQREEAALAAEDAAEERAERGERGDYPNDYPSDYTGGGGMSEPLGFEDESLDPAAVRLVVQGCYDLYSSLTALTAMPDLDKIIEMIPPERRVQINASLPSALAWLTSFQEAWHAQPWQNSDGGSDGGSDGDEYDYDADYEYDGEGDTVHE